MLGLHGCPKKCKMCKCEMWSPALRVHLRVLEKRVKGRIQTGSYKSQNKDEGSCLLVCSAVQPGTRLPTFQRSLLPPTSE
jgi:hypothetical protein